MRYPCRLPKDANPLDFARPVAIRCLRYMGVDVGYRDDSLIRKRLVLVGPYSRTLLKVPGWS